MNIKKITIFAVVLAALLGYIFSVEVPRQNADLAKKNLVPHITATELSRISITRGNESFVLVNTKPHREKKHDPADDVQDSNDEISGETAQQTSWILEGLPEAVLDPAHITSLTSSLTGLTSNATIEAKDVENDRSLYGLSDPALSLTYEGGGSKGTLMFGAKNDYAGERYLQIEGRSDLFMITEALFEAADRSAVDFRDKTPVSFSDASVREIEINGGVKAIRIIPDQNQRWKISEPRAARASSGAVYDLFRNLRNLQVTVFKDGEAALGMLKMIGNPTLTVSLKRALGDVVVTFYRNEDKIWMRLNQQQTLYQIGGDPTVSIPADVTHYRERRQFSFDNFFARAIRITHLNKDVLSLSLENESWRVNNKEADAPFVRQYIKDLSEVRAIGFVEDAPKDLFIKPALRIEVVLEEEGKSKTQTLLVGEKRAEGYCATVEGSEEVFVINEETMRALHATEERFVPAKAA